ncbi:MAG: helix-turn-helix domain-containing protein [Spartobacteria bacterium]
MSLPKPPLWNLPLSSCPKLEFCGVGRHGGLEQSHAYHYPRHWCLHAYQYHGIIAIEGIPYEVHPGTVSLVQPGARFEHRWPGSDCVHYFAIFGLSSRGATSVAVSALLRLGAGFEVFKSSLEPVVYGAATRPLRAAARLWDLLWTMAEFFENTTEIVTLHPVLVRAHRWMQDHSAELIHLPQLAAHCGVSANHLIRLFHKEHGMGPAEWHRLNRIRRAEQLLRHSSLSVKAVAIETGFTDLQQFNKLVRKHCGNSPRNLR